MNNKPVHDIIGQEIQIGSFIAYGSLYGRSAGLNIGKVFNINWKAPVNNYFNRQPEEYVTVTVLGCRKDWNEKFELLNKKSTLSFPERMVVLKESDLSEEIKSLYETNKGI